MFALLTLFIVSCQSDDIIDGREAAVVAEAAVADGETINMAVSYEDLFAAVEQNEGSETRVRFDDSQPAKFIWSENGTITFDFFFLQGDTVATLPIDLRYDATGYINLDFRVPRGFYPDQGDVVVYAISRKQEGIENGA